MDNEVLHQILKKLEVLDGRLDSMDGRLDRLDNDMSEVKSDLAFTKETAIRMEIEHGDQLKALFDGYSSLRDTLDEHTAILERLEHKVDQLDTVVGVYDIKLKALSK